MIRENFGRYCQTTIQRKILENSLYDDTQILENYCEEELFLSFLKEKSFTFDESEKNLLLQMRWYIFEKNSNLLEPSFKNPLLQIYQLIIETVTNHLASISEYLNSFDSPLYFLQEYCVFWLRYSFSIFELERIFKDFTKIMNQSYETQFPGMPSFPKFSIWRMMIKIWMSVLFETNEKKLLEAFEISINDLRSQNKIDLFRNYTFYERSSIQKDNFYKNNKIALRSLIHNFFECLTDASVNELTIHHLGHSEVIFL